MTFRDRADGGRRLAAAVAERRLEDPVVLALPRGGVPVAVEVAARLRAPLDVYVARKVGAPGHEELGIGAVGEGGAVVVDERSLAALGVPRAEFDELAARAHEELTRRVTRYRGGRPLPPLEGRDVVVVDDGLATGVTAEAALVDLRAHRPRTLLLAIPVCAADTAERLRSIADDVVCVHAPADFRAVGQWYDDFGQTTDEEVLAALGGATAVTIPVDGGAAVHGDLTVPPGARAVVVFAHGSGSSRHSARNRRVAEVLQREALATLLLDLLTAEEDAVDQRTREFRFDVDLLARRVELAVDWVGEHEPTRGLPIGCFGASTGAAAALIAAAHRPDRVAAVVSRGGRPDLAGDRLGAVRAPTLLIVGGNDREVLALNEEAAARLTGAEHRIEVVPGAGHLFEEPGTLDRAAGLAAWWFRQHLATRIGAR